MNRIVRQFDIDRRNSLVKMLLLVTAAAFLWAIAGCATKPEAYTPVTPMPKAEGLALAG